MRLALLIMLLLTSGCAASEPPQIERHGWSSPPMPRPGRAHPETIEVE